MDALSEAARRLIAEAMADEPDEESRDRGLESLVTRLSDPRQAEVITKAAHARADVAASPKSGDRVGRYLLLERLGQGAMGVVHQAYDPELQRTVALKLVNPMFGARGDPEEGRRRLVAEARSLAKLTHPNVVAVHDVGVHEQSVWLAMELVQGQDLAAWLAGGRRSAEDVVRVFRQAARGLAAAHDAGIIHRDFKPANVLIGDDRRVRISDFGLARAGAAANATPMPDDASALGPADADLTREGLVMGTPAYMAPEQHLGATELGPAADQFAFFVAFYEALWGRRPYAGPMAELVFAKENPPPEPAAMPAATRRFWPIVRKGLAPLPADRHGSMHEVVALLREPATRARTWLMAGAGLLLVGSIAWATGPGRDTGEACAGGAKRFAEIWNVTAANAIQQAFAATGRPSADRVAASVRTRLDEYGHAWADAYREACEATAVHKEQSSAKLDRRMSCLEERRRAAAALVDVLRTADASVFDRSLDATLRLPGLERCGNAIALERGVAPPEDPELRARVDDLRAELAVASAHWTTGQVQDGLGRVDAVLERVSATQYVPLQAEARLMQARLLDATGKHAEAASAGLDALTLAQGVGHDVVVAEAAILLLFIESEHLGSPRRAIAWGELAQATIDRSGGDTDLERSVIGVLAGAYREAGDHDAALALFEEAFAIDQGTGRKGIARAVTLNNYAALLDAMGRSEEAVVAFRDAIEEAEADVGPDDARLGNLHQNLGIALAHAGHVEQGLEHQHTAIAIFERVHGPDYPALAGPLQTIGARLAIDEPGDDAAPWLERALELAESGDARVLAGTLDNIGYFHLRRGRIAPASDAFARSIAIKEKLGADHADLVNPLYGMAEVYRHGGRHDEALALLHRARQIAHDKGMQGDEGDVIAGMASVLRATGELETALARQREANLLLEPSRVVRGALAEAHLLVDLGRIAEVDAQIEELRRDVADDRELRPQLDFVLARRTWTEPAKRTRAIELATSARDALRELGPIGTPGADEIEAWLQAHPSP